MKFLPLLLTPLLFTGCYMEMVDSGEVGVRINSGVVQDTPVREGFNFSINTMASLVTYNVKAKQLEM